MKKFWPLLILFLFSCKKENNELWTEIQVTASNYNTGEPLNDVFFSIVELNDNSSNSKLIHEDFTNEQGSFEHSFKARSGSKYSYELICQINLNKYYPIDFSQITFLQKGGVQVFNFTLVERSYLNIDLLNSNCENSNDELRFRYYLKKDPSDLDYIYIYNAYWEGELYWEGCVNLSGGSYQSLPAGEYDLEWNVQRDGGYTEGNTKINIPDGDSVTYLLEY